MAKITINTKQEVEITPEFLAEIFTELTSDDQVKFFEYLTKLWSKDDFDKQMYAVKFYHDISDEAVQFMRIIGE